MHLDWIHQKITEQAKTNGWQRGKGEKNREQNNKNDNNKAHSYNCSKTDI